MSGGVVCLHRIFVVIDVTPVRYAATVPPPRPQSMKGFMADTERAD